MVCYRVVIAVSAAMLLMISSVNAQQLPAPPPMSQFMGSPELADLPSGRYYSIGFKKFFSSFTSYQFPNPFDRATDPLSRLEFPIDQWFVGLRSGYRARDWSVDSQSWINASRDSRALMQDSDWDNESMPHQKTIFSESECRMNKGLLFDIAARMRIPLDLLTRIGDIRGIVGWRYEYFYFTTHDGEQKTFGDDDGTQALPGDGIDFTQSFTHTYLGGTARGSFDPSRILSLLPFDGSRLVPLLPQVNFEIQVDYAFVNARNEDLHLLREGNRVTTQNTRGHCWHGLFLVEFFTLQDMRTVVEVDFKRSLTRGNHRLTNSVIDLDFSFEGSRVWSDLLSVSVTGELRF